MPHYPDLYVLRHGQTVWNAEDRQQGQRDSPLTDKGRAQATAQGAILRDAGLAQTDITCFTSPLGRASATAEIALAAIGRVATHDDRLKEISFGAWEGLTATEICAGYPGSEELDPWDWHFAAPGGESLASLTARLTDFLDHLTGPAVIVTHGITSRALRGLWLGLGSDGMAQIGGGQGVVYHLSEGRQSRLDPPG